jgi:hypothetical protein
MFALENDRVEQLDELSSTGLALKDGLLARALRTGDEPGVPGEILLYDERGARRYDRVDCVSDIHDLEWHDGRLAVASTSSNSVVWLSPAGTVDYEWNAPGEGDAWHLNGLILKEGRMHASAFGRKCVHRAWDIAPREGSGFVLDLESGEEVLRGLSCPHSPRFFDDRWTVCNSAHDSVVQFEPNGSIRRVGCLKGWTRGIAFTREFVFVGESAGRGLDNAQHASVAVLDRGTWEIVDRIELPASEIYDLLIAPPAVLAGVRKGFTTNPLRLTEARSARGDLAGPSAKWDPSDLRARINADVPTGAPARALISVQCAIENLGGATFTNTLPYPVQVAYRWFTDDGEALDGPSPIRTRLARSLMPGDSTACRVVVRTPDEPGTFTLRLTLVQERVAWFDDIDPTSALDTRVTVGPQTDQCEP